MGVARELAYSIVGLLCLFMLVSTTSVEATVPVPATMTADGLVVGEPYRWMNCDGATAIGVLDGMAFLALQPDPDEPSVRRLVAIATASDDGSGEGSKPAGAIVREVALPLVKDMVFRLVRRSMKRSLILAVSKNSVTAYRCTDFAQVWSTVTYLNANPATTVARGQYFCFRYSQLSDPSMSGPNQPICYRTRDGRLHWVGPVGVGALASVESAYKLSESGALVVVNTTSTVAYNMSTGKPFLSIPYPAAAPSPTSYRYKGFTPAPPTPLAKPNGFLYGETLLLCVEAKLSGYSTLTGDLLWSFDDFASCRLFGAGGGWFAGGKTVFLASTTSSIAGYRLEDGGLLWSKPNPISTNSLLWSIADDESHFIMAPGSTTGINFLRPGMSVISGNPLTGELQAASTVSQNPLRPPTLQPIPTFSTWRRTIPCSASLILLFLPLG
jgi:hypothetical protein